MNGKEVTKMEFIMKISKNDIDRLRCHLRDVSDKEYSDEELIRELIFESEYKYNGDKEFKISSGVLNFEH